MQRLSALDAEFLHLEDGVTHMHIAGMSVFEGTPPTEEDVQALLASKLHLIPRYRQRVRPVPLELGRPVWVDDPHFQPRVPRAGHRAAAAGRRRRRSAG